MSTPSSSADRNLIFGLLALQMDFVSREQLLDAMNAWMLNKGTPLGQILRERGMLNERRADLLQAMVEEHLAQHGGDAQASLGALRIELNVRASLVALDDAEIQASIAPVTSMSLDDSVSMTVAPFAVRENCASGAVRYSKLRPHARGGLGEVFVARDEELHREVALKEIQDRFADHDDSRTRFVREAEITGHLEHPGVVPVYGLGTYADGRPFYAMRFIRGESLREAIERFHQADQARRDSGERRLALRELLTRFVAVCNAVAYAHSRGVIHRDLKPANIMLGEYGETLVVDWGVARLIEERDPEATAAATPVRLSAGSGTTPTELGQAVGTPAFMPPEQALGKLEELGPGSDVFALGAILYSVLTGEPPYKGVNAQQVLEQAKRGQVMPVRQRRADVPRALEAVCAKAMAVSPKERYTDARALAEEIRRWLADEPVQAYREPIADRVRRWGRRHRTMVSVGVALLLAGMVALGVGLWFVNAEKERTAEQRDRAVEAENEAKENLEQSRRNLKLAREAIDECYNVAHFDPLFQEPRMEQARNLLLRKTLRFYKNFRGQRPDDRALQNEEANQWHQVGYIEHVLQHSQDAREAYERARQLYQKLVQANPDIPEYQNDLALTHNNLGNLLVALGKREEAMTQYQQARSLQQKLVQTHPSQPAYQQALGSTHNNLGGLLVALGKREEAMKEYQCSRTLRLKLVQTHQDLPAYQKDLARTQSNMATLLSAQGKREEALKEYQLACILLQKLVQTHPDLHTYQHDLARTHNNRGKLLSDLGKREEALQEYKQARTLHQKVVQTHPDLPEYQHHLAVTHNNLGGLLRTLGKREEALKEYQLARTLQQKLVETHPDLHTYQHDLALTHYNLGQLLSDLGKREKAMKQYQQARTLQQKLVQTHPDQHVYQNDLAGTHLNLGNLLSDLGKSEEAVREYRQARALRLMLVKRHPDLHGYEIDLASTHGALGNQLSELGKGEEAMKEYQQARSLQQKLVRTHPSRHGYQRDLARSHNNLGNLLVALGKRAEAMKEYQQARSLRLKLVQTHPDLFDYQKDLARTHNNLGNLLVALGKGEEALKEYQQARTLQQKLIETHPDLHEYQNELARTHYNLGNLRLGLGKREEALQEYQQARTLQQKLVQMHSDLPEYGLALAHTCLNRGILLLQINRQREALADLDESIRQADRLRALHPKNPMSGTILLFGLSHRASLLARLGREREADADWDRVLRIAPVAQRPGLRLQRADSRARAGDYLRAAADAEKLAARSDVPAFAQYNLACIHALNAGAAAKDTARPLPEREKRAEQYARAAVELLQRAAAAGYFRDPKRIEHLDKDDDLAFLRDRDDFRAFRKTLKPKKP